MSSRLGNGKKKGQARATMNPHPTTMTRRSGGFTVTNWYAIENKKLDKSKSKTYIDSDGKQKGKNKMARQKSGPIEPGEEFVGRDGSLILTKYFKSSGLWNSWEVNRKIICSVTLAGVNVAPEFRETKKNVLDMNLLSAAK